MLTDTACFQRRKARWYSRAPKTPDCVVDWRLIHLVEVVLLKLFMACKIVSMRGVRRDMWSIPAANSNYTMF